MYPEDIEQMYYEVSVNTPVTIINQPYKIGLAGQDIYLEVHPPLEEALEDLESNEAKCAPLDQC